MAVLWFLVLAASCWFSLKTFDQWQQAQDEEDKPTMDYRVMKRRRENTNNALYAFLLCIAVGFFASLMFWLTIS